MPTCSDSDVNASNTPEQQEFRNIWERLRDIFSDQLPPVFSYLDVDFGDECTETLTELSETEIVDYVLNRNQTDDDGTESEDETDELPVPTILEVNHLLKTIMSFAFAKSQGPFVDEVFTPVSSRSIRLAVSSIVIILDLFCPTFVSKP